MPVSHAVKDDDYYLSRTLAKFPDVALITTDEPLRSALAGRGLKAISREEFLESHFGIR
jgi:rRNA-processing protein FCF1